MPSRSTLFLETTDGKARVILDHTDEHLVSGRCRTKDRGFDLCGFEGKACIVRELPGYVHRLRAAPLAAICAIGRDDLFRNAIDDNVRCKGLQRLLFRHALGRARADTSTAARRDEGRVDARRE